MQTITETPVVTMSSRPLPVIHSLSEWIEPHREDCLLDAILDACDALGVEAGPVRLLERIAATVEGSAAAQLLEAYRRLDPVLAHGVAVTEDDGGSVRLVVGVAGCSVVAEQTDTPPGSVLAWGWSITGERRGLAPAAV